MTVKTEGTERKEALSSTKFEGMLQLALEELNPSIRRSLLGISKRNSAYIIDYIINELKRENNASVNYVRMNIYAIVDLVKHCKKSDMRIITREDVISNFIIIKDGKEVFRASNQTGQPNIPLHSIPGTMDIPIYTYDFQKSGEYAIKIPVVGILFNPIKPEEADFRIRY
jgi:hypothetical protein